MAVHRTITEIRDCHHGPATCDACLARAAQWRHHSFDPTIRTRDQTKIIETRSEHEWWLCEPCSELVGQGDGSLLGRVFDQASIVNSRQALRTIANIREHLIPGREPLT